MITCIIEIVNYLYGLFSYVLYVSMANCKPIADICNLNIQKSITFFWLNKAEVLKFGVLTFCIWFWQYCGCIPGTVSCDLGFGGENISTRSSFMYFNSGLLLLNTKISGFWSSPNTNAFCGVLSKLDLIE